MFYGNAAMLGGLLKLVRPVVLSWCVATPKLVANRKEKNNAFFFSFFFFWTFDGIFVGHLVQLRSSDFGFKGDCFRTLFRGERFRDLKPPGTHMPRPTAGVHL